MASDSRGDLVVGVERRLDMAEVSKVVISSSRHAQ